MREWINFPEKCQVPKCARKAEFALIGGEAPRVLCRDHFVKRNSVALAGQTMKENTYHAKGGYT